MVNQVFQTGAKGIPLQSEANDKKFRLIFLDVGLMQNANKIDPADILNKDVWQLNHGALAEQFVGQELLTIGNQRKNHPLFLGKRVA